MSAMSGSGDLPIATVVVTTRDRPDLAPRAIASALAQTRADIEVVVVDDGSRPPFRPVDPDPRLRLVRRDDAGGVTSARNAGLAVARGAWVTFLDDDDELDPEMIERSLDAAARSVLPQPVAVNAAVRVLGAGDAPDTVLVPPDALPRGADYSLEGRGAAGRAANSLVVPTAVLRDIGGFDEAYVTFEHDDLGLRLNAVASIQGVPDPLYRMHPNAGSRLSRRRSPIPGDMERTLVKHSAAFARHPQARARFIGSIGFYHLEAGNWSDAIRWTARALRRAPRSARSWAFFAAALAGPYALRAYRWLDPSESTVPFADLQRRRVRKYARRLSNHPRAAVGAPLGRLTHRVADRVSAPTAARGTGSVLVLCIYRARNADLVARLVADAEARGWEVRLWALDAAAPSLAERTVGSGPGPKFPLLNRMVADVDLDRYDWLVVSDDDVAFERRPLGDLLAVAEAADLDFVQPAHVERSFREHEFTVRRWGSLARRTTFVEIGPLFAVARPWISRVVPFPADHTMGWGLELEWSDLEGEGMRLGIVDGVPIRHLSPVGKGYAKQEQRERLRALLDARGIASTRDLQRVRGTWRPWQARAPWADGRGDDRAPG